MTTDQIDALGRTLVRFSTVEILIIVFSVVLVITIIWLGRHWLRVRAEKQRIDNEEHILALNNENNIRLTELANDRKQVEEENNALLRQISNRFETLEATVTDVKLSTIQLETTMSQGSVDMQKMKEESTSRFDSISKSLDHLFFAVSDQKEKYYKVSQGTLENMLFTDSPKSIFDQLKAFYRLTAMGVNGRVQQKGMKLIIEHKDLWLDVLSLKLDVEIIDREYFDHTMEMINNQIFEGMMGV